jgi:hypothetical protein
MKEFNGHRSWNAWNVSLWISNEESSYTFAMDCLTRLTAKGNKPSLGLAVKRFMEVYNGSKTPDGASYNVISVRECLKGLMES